MATTVNPHAAAAASASLRLTPANSPFFRSPSPRSPTKQGSRNEEPGLRLRKVIGTTASTANGFDCIPAIRQFAYTAGAAAVVATVNDDLQVSQRFFRARPALGASSRDAGAQWWLAPGAGEPRSRALGLARDNTASNLPIGTPVRDWSDSPPGKSLTAKDRVKAATSVALSPNGKWIAMGETGYRPRVLLFSNKDGSSESPIVALAEHTFGVRALAFSPDSRYLASLGTSNDGFVYIWTVDDRTGNPTLYASNKCTVVINTMVWVGRSLLTAGLRVIKIWRPDDEDATPNTLSPIRTNSDIGKGASGATNTYQPQKVLVGKNCLLGDLLDTNFVTATSIGNDKAIVCAESGQICMLDDIAKSQFLRAVAKVDFAISACALDSNGALRLAGPSGCSMTFELSALKGTISSIPKRRQTIMPGRVNLEGAAMSTVALADIDHVLVEMDSRRAIKLTRPASADNEEELSHQLPAHHDSVLGVKRYASSDLPAAAFLTFSIDGSVRIWDDDGNSCSCLNVPVAMAPEIPDLVNELRAAEPVGEGAFIAAGDRYGTLIIMDVRSGVVVTQVRAHSAEICDIISFERSGCQLIVSAGRDRMIQLFSWQHGRLDLLQTMDEHAGAVNGLLVASSGNMLLSHSADRTIVVREAVLRAEDDPASVAFVILRTISLKSSPCSMCLEANESDILVSTMDRNVGKYSIKTGQAGFSFKCSDQDGCDAITMGKVLYAPSLNGNPTIVGVSSGDKSVRLYSEYGSLVARDWGHTEGVTDALMLCADDAQPGPGAAKTSPKLVTVAADSTIFMWDFATPTPIAISQTQDADSITELVTPKALAPMAPPLRKVLSYSEIKSYRSREKSIEEYSDSPTPAMSMSPPIPVPPLPPPSPPRLKKKTSRISMATAPKLEPAFRSNFADSVNGRRSLRRRSPSPPSPRTSKRDARRPSIGITLRSKSSESMLNQLSSSTTTANSNFGSITASTESVCRTLRAYRKKLGTATLNTSTNSTTSSKNQQPDSNISNLSIDTLRELEKEVKLTLRMITEKAHGSSKGAFDEAVFARLLDQASERFVGMLDERMKGRTSGGEADFDSVTSGATDVTSTAPAERPGLGKRAMSATATSSERVKALTSAVDELRIKK